LRSGQGDQLNRNETGFHPAVEEHWLSIAASCGFPDLLSPGIRLLPANCSAAMRIDYQAAGRAAWCEVDLGVVFSCVQQRPKKSRLKITVTRISAARPEAEPTGLKVNRGAGTGWT